MTWQYTDFAEVYGSSSVDRVWYNALTRQIAVEYLSGDQIYGWNDVLPTEWAEIASAADDPSKSIGSYLARNIKGKKIGFLPDTDEDGDFEGVNFDAFQPATAPVTEVAHTRGQYRFDVSYVETATVSVMASSIEEAIAKVADGNEDISVMAVSVKFD